ncbi:MAG: hypothetical protein FWC09_11135 [Lachnospiraceae bacterium]|nr:hypothetical protein [Lachnospiraceae bacterium]
MRKILEIFTYSLIALFIYIFQFEMRIPWRSWHTLTEKRCKDDTKEYWEWSDSDKKEYRKKEYKIIFALWLGSTVVVAYLL